jgi:DNA-binding HxlR family transcriptional regulator
MKEMPFNCGMEAVLDLLAGKWKLLIVYHLMHGEQLRFSELRRLIGNVSEKMLSQHLKEMACDGLVQRIDFHTVPPHVEYALTEFGKSLARTLQPLCAWGSENMEEIGAISSARAVRSA